jgi:hypothetical protein
MTQRSIIRRFSSIMLAALVFGCSADTPSAPTTDGPFLEIDPLFAGVDQGTTLPLTATFSGAAVPVTWETSDAAVATVSATGVVTGVAPGTAAATATLTSDPTKKRSASITVLALQGTALTSGVPATGLSGTANGQTKLYRIFVPAGTTSLSVVLAGGTGDADIFVKRQTPPTSSSFTCSSEGATTNEACAIANPASGTWYILVVSFIYSGASLTATLSP